jgi:hypothetical protein
LPSLKTIRPKLPDIEGKSWSLYVVGMKLGVCTVGMEKECQYWWCVKKKTLNKPIRINVSILQY